MTTFLNAEGLGFTNLSADLPCGLFLTRQYENAAFLICTASQKFAVCLEKSSGFNAVELEATNEAWRGCFVSNVEVQADLSTAFTSAQQDIAAGDLVINKDGVFVASRPVRIGQGPHLVRWTDAPTLGSGTITGAFNRWRVIRRENDNLQILKEVDSEA
ncbi:hypothetical protein H9L13_00030 [Sphingomonas lutea]|uniref:Uncharacterized protein n=1 Tax=Sphingomonas lutea TaxID=1045317 RepID=A0A7G9SHT1_9SPHN|nr:hypothetical protein [Sphingomonas lutea]QNN67406.1 hypothetical protein H9L13_00030 [Sphingomonas lutea]